MKDLDKIIANPRMWTRDKLKEALDHCCGSDCRRIKYELDSRGPITHHRPKLPDMSRAVTMGGQEISIDDFKTWNPSIGVTPMSCLPCLTPRSSQNDH